MGHLLYEAATDMVVAINNIIIFHFKKRQQKNLKLFHPKMKKENLVQLQKKRQHQQKGMFVSFTIKKFIGKEHSNLARSIFTSIMENEQRVKKSTMITMKEKLSCFQFFLHGVALCHIT